MNPETVFRTLATHRVIPVIAIDAATNALPLADALVSGGLPVVEITFRTAAAAAVIQIISRERPGVLVGAGTVLTVENLEKAQACGAAFGVAPGFNPRLVRRAAELGMAFIPGVATPTEIEAALELGCRMLKFFPAGALGGLKALQAISVPYLHTGVRFVPTGGINAENLREYLSGKHVAAVGGTWLATKEDIEKGAWEGITSKCRQAVTIRDAEAG